jgi:hypothetical protein
MTGAPGAEIPLTDIGSAGAGALFEAHPERAATLLGAALGTHPLLPFAARLADTLSRRWLERQRNPYLDEIGHIAERLAAPGVYFLNIVYEWACSTSAAPDPAGEGMRLIRVLDWGLAGIGRHLVIARHQTAHGPFYSATWPGFAGVLSAMAPGRFAAAINQAPRVPISGARWLDEALGRVRLLRAEDALPAAHLLRQVCERASDYASAIAMLSDESVTLAMPALFTLAGVTRGDACVIEAQGRRRGVHRAPPDERCTIAVANDWLNREWRGEPRCHAAALSPAASARDNNRRRRDDVAALQSGAFSGAADLAPPVLNAHTVLVMAANAASGELAVEALDRERGAALPQVVARRALRH